MWWSRQVGVNAFSLNGLYRTRLVRAFATAMRRPSTEPRPPRRARPDLTLGLRCKTVIRPLHLVNAVVNDAGVRDRQAEPFTLSALHCGSRSTGYRPTLMYGRALTMGRAMAISGAAANPSMGYFSSRPVLWLMGFFNLRLGWWLVNPSFQTMRGKAEPSRALTPYLEELLGTSGTQSEYINLSDGGHFDNLGLYEAIRRECRYIVAIDASYDPKGKHFDLARAERLIRIDFGVELKWKTSKQVGHYRVACIVYPSGQSGHLVYVSPQLTGNEPADVLAGRFVTWASDFHINPHRTSGSTRPNSRVT
jgi:hypothetical protein